MYKSIFNASSSGGNIKMQQNFVCGKDWKSTKQKQWNPSFILPGMCGKILANGSVAERCGVPISHHYRFLRFWPGRCGTTWQETSCDWLVGCSHKSCQKKSIFCVSFYIGTYNLCMLSIVCISFCTNIQYRGQIQSFWSRDKVDSGIGLRSTQAWP